MIQFLPWILGALAGVTLTLVVIAILKWDVIVNWFQHRAHLKQVDLNNVGFTLMTHQLAGNFRTIQGVFNKRTYRVAEARQIDSQQIDPDLTNVHAGKEVVLYE